PIGTSENNQTMYALKVTADVSNENSTKPAFLFTGLTHAREWATGSTTMQTAGDLLKGYSSDSAMTRRLDKAEIWFIPVVNPDGYNYSLNTDTMWRKNRKVIYADQTACPASGAKHDSVGVGVDINRNY